MKFLNESHKELIDAVKTGDLVIFAGAGVSKDAGLPLWGELIDIIIKRINNNNTYHGSVLKLLYSNIASEKKIFDVLNYIERQKLNEYVNRVLNEEIYEKGKDIVQDDSKLQLQDKLWKITNKIITPNYDVLLEKCHSFLKNKYSLITKDDILSLSDINRIKTYLLKIHGSIEKVPNIIFYESDYKNQYETQKTAIADRLKFLVSDKPMLFIGTSMSDPYINEIIKDVNTIFKSTHSGKFIVSNEQFDSAIFTKIKGEPVKDLNDFLDELLEIKNETALINSRTEPQSKRMKTIERAIEDFCNENSLFPPLEDFKTNRIKLNQNLYKYLYLRFEKHEGPVLIQGRWGTGKTVTTLRLGLEMQKKNYTTYYLDFSSDIAAGAGNLYKIYKENNIARYNKPGVIFILDNVHIYPDITFKIAKWAFKEKANIIFIGRPITDELEKTDYYYPYQFYTNPSVSEVYNSETDEGIEFENEHNIKMVQETPIINLKPGLNIYKQIFNKKITELGIEDELNEKKLSKFAELTGYNLFYAVLHLKNLRKDTKNIYEVNYKFSHDFLNDKYHFKDYNEVYILAAVCMLDCKADENSLFKDPDRLSKFLSKQILLNERRNYLFGLSTAEARLIIEVGCKFGHLRDTDNNPLGFISALAYLLKEYFESKPINAYEVLFGLMNFQFEANEIKDYYFAEELEEIIYSLLTNENLITFFSEEIIPERTNSFLVFGFFIRIVLKYKVDYEISQKLFTTYALSKLVSNYKEYFESKYKGTLYLNWHFKYVWSALKKIHIDLADIFLKQIPEENLLSFGQYSLRNLGVLLEMARSHDYVNQIILNKFDLLMGDDDAFRYNFKKLKEVSIYFFIRNTFRYSNHRGNINSTVFTRIKEVLSPAYFAQCTKKLYKVSVTSINTAKQFLGKEYLDALRKVFTDDFIYTICFGNSLSRINVPFNDFFWRKFLKKDFSTKLKNSNLAEIQLFFRNILLHGFNYTNQKDLVKKLFEKDTKNILFLKILNAENTEPLLYFFWNLNSIDNQMFNVYFSKFIVEKGEDLTKALRNSSPVTVCKFLLLIYCYAEDRDIGEFIDKTSFNSYVSSLVNHASIEEKVFLNSISFILNNEYTIPYDAIKERLKLLHFEKNILLMEYSEDDSIMNADNSNYTWMESKLIQMSVTILGIYFLDKSALASKNLQSFLGNLNKNICAQINEIKKNNQTFITGKIKGLKTVAENRIRILNLAVNVISNYVK